MELKAADSGDRETMRLKNLNGFQTALSSPNCGPEKKTANTGAVIMMKISKISDCASRLSDPSHRYTASRLTVSSCYDKFLDIKELQLRRIIHNAFT